MNRILILTKNILAEQQLQQQLQLLNYEVFCSAEIYRNSKLFPIFQYFPMILMSETISNYEIDKFLAHIGEENNFIIRLTMGEPLKEEVEKWKEIGIASGLSKSASLDGIREKLVLLQSLFYEERIEKETHSCPPIKKIENRSIETANGRVYFSKKEERLFKLLLEAEGALLSRDDICHILWSEGETDSNRSQLSCIASKIKNKFKEAGYEGDTIITKWGQGYALAPGFFQYLSTGRLDEEYPEFIRERPILSGIPL